MNLVITVAGLAGLAVATYFFAELAVDAVRRRQFLDLGVAAGVVALTVWLLLAYGDTLLQ